MQALVVTLFCSIAVEHRAPVRMLTFYKRVFFRGKNDNSTPEELNYCAIEGSIVDATDESEDGALKFKVEKAGTLST